MLRAQCGTFVLCGLGYLVCFGRILRDDCTLLLFVGLFETAERLVIDQSECVAEHGEKSELPRGFFDKENSFQAIFAPTHMAFCKHASQLLGLTIHRRASMATDKRNPRMNPNGTSVW